MTAPTRSHLAHTSASESASNVILGRLVRNIRQTQPPRWDSSNTGAPPCNAIAPQSLAALIRPSVSQVTPR